MSYADTAALRQCVECRTPFRPKGPHHVRCSHACTQLAKNRNKSTRAAHVHIQRGQRGRASTTRRVWTCFTNNPGLLAECRALLEESSRGSDGKLRTPSGKRRVRLPATPHGSPLSNDFLVPRLR